MHTSSLTSLNIATPIDDWFTKARLSEDYVVTEIDIKVKFYSEPKKATENETV